jgi:hypothetical protein
MDMLAVATVGDGKKVRGRMTTEDPACENGSPVFIDETGHILPWHTITHVSDAAVTGAMGGSSKSPRKMMTSAENGKRGGRPRKVRP